jgi:class 3 adenylate cyclase
MDGQAHHTVLCSVVFLDIVKYSETSVGRQERVKSQFNQLVAAALARVPPSERIVLDTGDGAALCFISDPEDALFTAIELRNSFGQAVQEDGRPFPSVRIGINLGPVRMVEDLNGNQNLIGEAINSGQRVMSFCEPGQILVSRSYFEVVGCLSSTHAALFRYLGVRQDKHVREHVIYEVQIGAQDPHDPTVESTTALPKEPLQLSPEALASVETALTRELGPMAKVILLRALAESTDECAFYQRLAAAVPDGPHRAAFLAHCPSEATAKPAAAPSAAASTAAPSDRAWTQEELAAAEHALTRYLGPLAHLLVSRAAREHTTLTGLYQSLASEIPNDHERKHFLASAPLAGPGTRA